MQCCSRSTVGVIIGAIYVLVSVVVFVLIGVSLILSKPNDDNISYSRYSDVSTFMTMSLVIALVSGLLIMGIVKKRHNYMLPWMIAHVICTIYSGIFFMVGYFSAGVFGAPKEDMAGIIVFSVIAIAVQLVILGFMFVLYRGIRKANIDQPQLVMGSPQVSYQSQPYSYTTVPIKTEI